MSYVAWEDQVIGLIFNGQPLAVPLKLLWYHEVVNLEGNERLTVTYSPLTGSSRVFSGAPPDGGDFSVSTYVDEAGLVMADSSGTLYSQMRAEAVCGVHDGVALETVPYEQMTLLSWLFSFPDTWIVGRVAGTDFPYTLYPYGNYELPSNPYVPYPLAQDIDRRLLPKQRVVGVPDGRGGGVAFSLAAMERLAEQTQEGNQDRVWAANASVDGEPVVAFWNSGADNAGVFIARANGMDLTFEVDDRRRVDTQTGTSWNFAGQAVAGPLAGEELTRHPTAHHAFWFAWAAIHPDTDIWTNPSTPAAVVPGH